MRCHSLFALRCSTTALLLVGIPSWAPAQSTRVRVDLRTDSTRRDAVTSVVGSMMGYRNGERVAGTLISASDDTLRLSIRSSGTPIVVPTREIVRVEVSRGQPSRWRTALDGMIAPAIVNATLSALMMSVKQHSSVTPARAALSGAITGAAVGAALGAWFPAERWRVVALDSLIGRR
jgi:hypothetical protein